MTSILPPVATGACRRPNGNLDRTGVPPASGWSRDGSHVSQDRDGWPQIQSRITEGHVQREMIGAMHELPYHLLTDWASDAAGYTSAYRSSYTVVYTRAKEVS
jgi:hypothetical protein